MKLRFSLRTFFRFQLPVLLLLALAGLYARPWLLRLGKHVRTGTAAVIQKIWPAPIPVYRLSGNFHLVDQVLLSLSLQPGLAEASGDKQIQGLADLRAKLIQLDVLRQNARPESIGNVLGADLPLPPEELLRGFCVYGILEEEDGGYWLTAKAFQPENFPEMASEYLALVLRLREQMTVTPQTYASLSGISPEESLDQLEQLVRAQLLKRAPTRESRYLLSRSGRGPLANEMIPRQILLLWSLAEAPAAEAQTTAAEYAGRFDVADPQRAGLELQQLVSAGWLTEGT